MKLGVYALAAMTLLATGNKETKIEFSDILQENAKVVKTRYETARADVNVLGTQVRYTNYPPRYIVKFDGRVDFEVDSKELFDIFKEGDPAVVFYREILRRTYEDVNGDGFLEMTGSKIRGHKFVNAHRPQPVNSKPVIVNPQP
jgi:hypothetical protein